MTDLVIGFGGLIFALILIAIFFFFWKEPS
jgi:hypothetical protein